MRRLLTVLITLLGFTLLAAPPVSAAASVQTENRASGSAAVAEILTQENTRLSTEAVRENIALGYDVASDDAVAARAGVAAENGFFQGSRYTQKVLEQMKNGADKFHSFPESVGAFERAGTVRTITGGDGVVRQMLEIPGSYGGRNGVFQFIKEADGTINHRLFVPGP